MRYMIKMHLLNRLLIVLTWLGIFVSGMLTADYYLQGSLLCKTASCSSVTPSFIKWLGFPIGLYGLVAYTCLMVLIGLRFWVQPEKIQWVGRAGLYLSGAGSAISFLLIIQNITTQKEICRWCFASTIIFFIIFFVYVVLFRIRPLAKLSGWINETLFYGGMMLAVGSIALQSVEIKREEDFLEAGLKIVHAPTLNRVIPEFSHFKGNADANVTIIEFGNFYCPNCRKAYHFLDTFYQRSGGKLRLGFCHVFYPNSPSYDLNLASAKITELAARDGKYWEMIKRFYSADPKQMITKAGLLEIAHGAGLRLNKVRESVDSTNSSISKRVERDLKCAKIIPIPTTPTFLIYAKNQPVRMATSATIKYILTHPSYSNLIYSNAN